MNYFLKSSVGFFVVAFMSVAMSASAVFATITGDNSSENYTYSSDNSSDVMYTNTMTGSGYWNSVSGSSVTLNPSTAVSLTAQGVGTNYWYNNAALNLSTSGSSIYLDNIRVNNYSSLQADSLNVGSDARLFSESGSLNFGTITNNGYISSYASDITVASGIIESNRSLVFYGGTNNNEITGTGTLYMFSSDFINNANITQSYIQVYSGITVNNSTGSLITTRYFDIASGSTLNAGINDIDTYSAGGYIRNNGVFNINADGSNYNTLYGTGGMQISSSSSVTNYATVNQSEVTINTGSSFETNADLLNLGSGQIVNDGDIIFTGGTNDDEITGTGDLFGMGNVTNNADVEQASVNITSGTFTNNAEITANNIFISTGATLLTTNMLDTYTAGGAIYNDGTLQVNVDSSSAVNNPNIITGVGEFDLLGNTDFYQQAGSTITQSAINISSGASLTANADDLVISDKIYNDGNLTLEGTYVDNNNEITGTGGLFINGSIQNLKNINQENLTINDSMVLWNVEGSTITIADNLSIGSSADLINNGILNVVNGVNNGSITYGTTSEGIINISGNFVNNGNMAQEELYISSSAYVITNASNSNIHKIISNDGDFVFTGGISDDNITGTGTLTYNGAESNLTNTADISQFAVNITTGTFNNVAGSSITATNIDIESNGVLQADIDDINTYDAGGRISNDGYIAVNANGENLNAIIGNGTFEIMSGYTVFNSSSIVQGSLINNWDFVNNATGTVNVGLFDNNMYGQNDGLIDTDNFINDGPFINTAGAIINADILENNDSFANNGNTNADYLVNQGLFFNDNALNIKGGVNYSTITRQSGIGFGTMTVTEGVFDNSGGRIVQYAAVIENGGHLITDADNLILDTDISNDSILEFTGGTIVNRITGAGTLLLTGVVGSSNTINQEHLGVYGSFRNSSNTYVTSAYVDAGASVVNDAGSNLFIDSLTNDGTIDNSAVRGSGFEVGNVINSGNITGTGDIQISGLFINDSSGTLTQGNINIMEDAGLQGDASSFTGNINNAGTVTFYGGTNNNEISDLDGTYGDLIIFGDVINNADIHQENMTVSNGATFTSTGTATEITIEDVLTNKGVVTSSGTVSVFRLNNSGGAVFTNDGVFSIDNFGINTATINGTGSLNTSGSFINYWDISQSTVTIAGGILTNEKTGTITAGNIFVNSGATLSSQGMIDSSNIFVSSGATLLAQGMIDTFTAGGAIYNDGIVQVDVDSTGGVTVNNENMLIGTGRLDILGNTIFNQAIGTTITQGTIAISSAAAMSASASDLIISDVINNYGSLTFIGGTNNTEITGSGVLNTTGTFTNNAAITQNTVNVASGSFTNNAGQLITTDNLNIYSGAVMTTDADDVKADIDNDGTLNFNASGTNTNDINGTGELIISDNAQVENTGAIVQNIIFIDDRSSFTTNASLLNGTTEIANGWDLHFTGGLNTTTITDPNDGALLIDGYVENASGVSITQQYVGIGADNRFTVNAGDLNITNMIENNGILELKDENDSTLEEDIYGSGYLIKTGAGIVNLTGENTYTGETAITEGALQVSNTANIGENSIFFNGGKLIASTNSFTLSNDFTATEGNDVNIDVINGGELTLNGVINQQSTGEANLVKGGDGTLILDMYDNYYQGDTYVSSGTLVGTTRNINGVLHGTGANNFDTYNFDDRDYYKVIAGAENPKYAKYAPEHVILNEVDSTNYIGTFNKTGSAYMDVVNYFRAYAANISAGRLYVNNIESGNDFIVDSTMTFTNSLLGGNSNITATTVVMGEDSVLAPGNSIGTTNITGDLVFASSSTYQVEFEQPVMQTGGVNSDLTNVTGTVVIESTGTSLDLINLNGKYYVHDTFNVITSSGGLSGEFAGSSITGYDVDTADLRLGSRIDFSTATVGNNLQLTVSRKASDYNNSPELTDMSHNEKEVARSIDAISTGNGGDITNALNALEQYYYYTSTYDLDALKAGFNDIAGVIHANSALLPYFNAKIEHVYDKIQPREADDNPCRRFHDKIWGEYYYNNYKVDKDENSPKYQTYVNGFLVGFDMISDKSWTMGIMSGYGENTLNQEQDKTDMKDVNLGFYGGYETDKWQFKSMLFAGWERYNTERNITFMNRTAKSDYQGYSASLDFEGAYKILLTKKQEAKHKITLKPFAGMLASYIKQNGFEEKGAGSLNLKVEDNNMLMAQARLGVGVAGKINRFGWYANAGARQLLTKDYSELNVSLLDYSGDTKMKIKSAKISPFSITGGIGADYILSEDWTVFSNAQANFADKSEEIYANAGLTYKFGCPNRKKIVTEGTEDFSYELEAEKQVSRDLREQLEKLQKDYDKMKERTVSVKEAEKIKERKITEVELENKPQFKFNSTELTEKGKASLQQIVKELQRYPKSELLIEGHCDNYGTPEYNQKLSEGRANALAESLEKDYGIKNKILIIGKGATENIVPNDTLEHREMNRRVEVTILNKEDVEAGK